jgi:hypothetical protein
MIQTGEGGDAGEDEGPRAAEGGDAVGDALAEAARGVEVGLDVAADRGALAQGLGDAALLRIEVDGVAGRDRGLHGAEPTPARRGR